MTIRPGKPITIEVSKEEAEVIEHALYFATHIQDHRKSKKWEPLRIAMAETLKRRMLNGTAKETAYDDLRGLLAKYETIDTTQHDMPVTKQVTKP